MVSTLLCLLISIPFVPEENFNQHSSNNFSGTHVRMQYSLLKHRPKYPEFVHKNIANLKHSMEYIQGKHIRKKLLKEWYEGNRKICKCKVLHILIAEKFNHDF
jgi:hypothetical protein